MKYRPKKKSCDILILWEHIRGPLPDELAGPESQNESTKMTFYHRAKNFTLGLLDLLG